MKPVKPDKLPPLFRFSVPPPPTILSVPVPESVPLSVTVALLPVIFGLAPSGIVQLLLIVLVLPVCVSVIRLNVTLLQDRVCDPLVPLKFTVPPLALKVGLPEMVIAPLTLVVPLEAVKLPPDRVKAAVVSVWLPAVNVPAAWLKVVDTVKLRLRLIVPV